MAKPKNVIVNRRPDGEWQAKKVGAERALIVAETQKEAREVGRKAAISERSELIVMGENGQIREKNSYGNDPNPPKDKR
jgi:hypothetical protein